VHLENCKEDPGPVHGMVVDIDCKFQSLFDE
jgi:hypothetical protein